MNFISSTTNSINRLFSDKDGDKLNNVDLMFGKDFLTFTFTFSRFQIKSCLKWDENSNEKNRNENEL